jgi:predicted acylesterase/phospholipase RssA
MQQGFVNDSAANGVPGLQYWEMLFPRMRTKMELFSWDNFLLNMLRNKTIQSPFSTHGIAQYLKTHVIKTDRFSDLEPDLFVVSTEVNQSKKVIFGKYKSLPVESYLEYRNDVSISDACAASMALPPVYHPYSLQIDGVRKDFFDGEIREPLSSHIARDLGCDLIICSYTHQPVRMPPGKGSLSDKGIHQVTLQAIYQAIEQKIQQSRGYRQKEKALIDAVRKFFKDKELPDSMCDELVGEIEARMTYKSNVDYIHIQPRASDHEMFLLPHFSLNRKKTERIVKKGFLAAMSALQGFKLEESA